MTDPWEGIPQELREKIDACFDVGSFLGAWQQRQEATADLTAAIRSLVSRLREAEQDTKRLDWVDAAFGTRAGMQFWSDCAFEVPRSLRRKIDAARSPGE